MRDRPPVIRDPDDGIKLGNLIKRICNKVNVDPKDVARIIITPTRLDITFYKRDVNNKFFVDSNTGDVAQTTNRFAVTTDPDEVDP